MLDDPRLRQHNNGPKGPLVATNTRPAASTMRPAGGGATSCP